MKKESIILLPVMAMLLSACSLSFLNNLVNHNQESDFLESSSRRSSETSSDKSSSESSKTSSSSESSEELSSSSNSSSDTSSSDSSSSSESEIPPKPTGKVTFEVYSTNDIHGAVEEEYDRAGISKLATYLKDKGDKENVLLLDQGDTWQGSIYSNYNHGNMITDVMNYIHYDARSVGNHDFDWGLGALEANSKRSYNGYSVPVLAGNVYDFNFATKEVGTEQMSNLGRKSVTYTLANGVKVGILGGIGEDQITSITSTYTETITFTSHVDFIKEEAQRLRNDESCDVVIASIHTGQDEVLNTGVSNYVDLVLCGHTHRQEYTMENNVAFVQSYAYSKSVGHITLTYDFDQGKVSKTSLDYISASTIKSTVSTIDSGVKSIVSSYNEDCTKAANEVVASNVSGNFYSSEELPNLMCHAIYDECVKEGQGDVLLTYTNVARASLYNSSWTYADLYQAFPFDNVIYIFNITGDELLNEVGKYNYIYRNPSFTNNNIDPNGTYKIATIDYLYSHTNSSRYYDYFSKSAGTYITTLNDNYRIILKNWLIDNGYKSSAALVASDYSSSNWAHDRTAFVEQ